MSWHISFITISSCLVALNPLSPHCRFSSQTRSMQKSQWTLKKNSNYKKSIKDVAVILKTATTWVNICLETLQLLCDSQASAMAYTEVFTLLGCMQCKMAVVYWCVCQVYQSHFKCQAVQEESSTVPKHWLKKLPT